MNNIHMDVFDSTDIDVNNNISSSIWLARNALLQQRAASYHPTSAQVEVDAVNSSKFVRFQPEVSACVSVSSTCAHERQLKRTLAMSIANFLSFFLNLLLFYSRPNSVYIVDSSSSHISLPEIGHIIWYLIYFTEFVFVVAQLAIEEYRTSRYLQYRVGPLWLCHQVVMGMFPMAHGIRSVWGGVSFVLMLITLEWCISWQLAYFRDKNDESRFLKDFWLIRLPFFLIWAWMLVTLFSSIEGILFSERTLDGYPVRVLRLFSSLTYLILLGSFVVFVSTASSKSVHPISGLVLLWGLILAEYECLKMKSDSLIERSLLWSTGVIVGCCIKFVIVGLIKSYLSHSHRMTSYKLRIQESGGNDTTTAAYDDGLLLI